MVIIDKIIVFIVGIIAGVALMKYNFQLTRLFGYQEYAERFLGTGGTYTMWKLIGLGVIVCVIIYVFVL